MKTLYHILLLAALLTLLISCQSQTARLIDATSNPPPLTTTPIPTPRPAPEQKFAITESNEPYDPFPYKQVDSFGEVKAGRLSGVVSYPPRRTVFAVSDEGRIIEIETDGSLIQKKQLRKKADFEGITYSPATEMLYIAIEGDEVILEVNPETLEIVRDIPIDRAFEGSVLLAPEGCGIEGITFVPSSKSTTDGTFYLVNQSHELEGTDSSIIFEVDVSNVAGKPIARILRYFSVGVTDLSGIYYVPAHRHLFVISDTNDVLLVVSLSGQILDIYSLPGKKQEGITLDEDNFLYIAEDAKNTLLKFKPFGFN